MTEGSNNDKSKTNYKIETGLAMMTATEYHLN